MRPRRPAFCKHTSHIPKKPRPQADRHRIAAFVSAAEEPFGQRLPRLTHHADGRLLGLQTPKKRKDRLLLVLGTAQGSRKVSRLREGRCVKHSFQRIKGPRRRESIPPGPPPLDCESCQARPPSSKSRLTSSASSTTDRVFQSLQNSRAIDLFQIARTRDLSHRQ